MESKEPAVPYPRNYVKEELDEKLSEGTINELLDIGLDESLEEQDEIEKSPKAERIEQGLQIRSFVVSIKDVDVKEIVYYKKIKGTSYVYVKYTQKTSNEREKKAIWFD